MARALRGTPVQMKGPTQNLIRTSAKERHHRGKGFPSTAQDCTRHPRTEPHGERGTALDGGWHLGINVALLLHRREHRGMYAEIIEISAHTATPSFETC